MNFMALAAQALSQDEFSKCFEPKPVAHHPGLSLRYLVYLAGMLIRYGILFPIRLTVLVVGALLFAGLLPLALMSGNEEWSRVLFMSFCKLILFCFSAWIRHHGEKPQPGGPHIFVANHTSFTDFFLLSSHEFPHATVAQVHGGFFGLLQRHALSLNGSLFFYRDETKDKEKLAKKMRDHVNVDWQQKSPLIIFPEGTCVNNEYTVLFHKGAFELGCDVCPVAIKYNKRLLDPYWNTREQSFTQHVLYLMTRWCMIADVWWLPPQRRAQGETSIDFAKRVKAMISEAAGLKNLSWDGYLKNFVRQHDHEKLRRSSQAKYVHSLRLKLPSLIAGPGITDASADNEGDKDFGSKQAMKRLSMGAAFHNDNPNAGKGNPNRYSGAAALNPRNSFLEGLEPARIVELKNEILVASPIPIMVEASKRGTATVSASAGTVPAGESLIEHLSERKDRVINSWKRFSMISRLDQHHHLDDEAAQEEQEEARLDYTGWRLWNKHQKEYQERRRSAFAGHRRKAEQVEDKGGEEEDDLFNDAISTGIDLDDHDNDEHDDNDSDGEMAQARKARRRILHGKHRSVL